MPRSRSVPKLRRVASPKLFKKIDVDVILKFVPEPNSSFQG